MRNDRSRTKSEARKPIPTGAIILSVIAVALLGTAAWHWAGNGQHRSRRTNSAADYVGRERCAQCHAEQAKAWRDSHHAQAMRVANEATVLGNFKDAHFTKDGVKFDFFQKDNKFYVNTPGRDGRPADFQFTYTFGVYPLQQYLTPFPGGRLQSFVVTWDTRDQRQNGQRWFDLYPDEKIAPGDPLHWTGRNQTWNYMCAECHSTNLRKNYDLAKDTYATTWSEIEVPARHAMGQGQIT